MTFKFTTEKELCNLLYDNSLAYFGFSCTGKEVAVKGGRIDLIGEDEETVYIIEVKRESVNDAAINQLRRYMESYATTKLIRGIIAAPSISSNFDRTKLGDDISLAELSAFKYIRREGTKVRLSVYFPPDVREWLHEQADIEQITVSEYVNGMLREYMENPELLAEIGDFLPDIEEDLLSDDLA